MSVWSVASNMKFFLDNNIKNIKDLPYTISYVIRKMIQIDSLNELPKEKRPPEEMIWEGSSEDIGDWLDRVYDRKPLSSKVYVDESEIE